MYQVRRIIDDKMCYILKGSPDVCLKDNGWRAWEWAHGKFQESDEPRVTD